MGPGGCQCRLRGEEVALSFTERFESAAELFGVQHNTENLGESVERQSCLRLQKDTACRQETRPSPSHVDAILGVQKRSDQIAWSPGYGSGNKGRLKH